MEIKFFAKEKVLDLTGKKISVAEHNSKVSDKMFTKYLFPFEIYMDEEFKRVFGDYSSFDADNLDKIIPGQLLFEDKYHEARLELLSVEGDYLTGQIDFGFEEVPNFDKMLRNLPLEKFKVDNIHTFAAQVAAKKYPQTNYNFPRLYYGRYSPEDKVWDAYNGFINDMNDDGTALRNNYIDTNGEVYNVNIIHPMPHILYLLKTGFADAGYELAGDILTDPMLAQEWVFSGTDYFSRKIQRRFGFNFTSAAYDELFLETGPDDYAQYYKIINIEKPGVYKIAGKIEFWKASKMSAWYRIYLDKKELWNRIIEGGRDSVFEHIALNLDFNVTEPNSKLRVYILTQYHEDSWTHNMVNLTVTSNALDEYTEDFEGEDMGVITNLNEIDLTRAVPDFTFGELVNRIRNFLNYDVDYDGSTIIMNRIAEINPDNVVDFKQFEVLKPRINILNKKSFAIMMPTWENDEKADSVYYDETGMSLNKSAGEGTTVIETNSYALPAYAAIPQGPVTAVVKKYDSSLLQLVRYEGKTGIQNNAVAAPDLTFPSLFYSNWEPFLRSRLRSASYSWTYTYDAGQKHVAIKDIIGCYQNMHIIKERVRDFNGSLVEVTITTETVR